jgi:hypothetical protein
VELSVDPPLATPPDLSTLSASVLRTAARPQATLALGHPALQALSSAAWGTPTPPIRTAMCCSRPCSRPATTC